MFCGGKHMYTGQLWETESLLAWPEYNEWGEDQLEPEWVGRKGSK